MGVAAFSCVTPLKQKGITTFEELSYINSIEVIYKKYK